jgi:hypothetical protein
MKGHMQDGKFHPHTDYKKGTRKSRDQKVKQQGVKIKPRKQRMVAKIPQPDGTETVLQINDNDNFDEVTDPVERQQILDMMTQSEIEEWEGVVNSKIVKVKHEMLDGKQITSLRFANGEEWFEFESISHQEEYIKKEKIHVDENVTGEFVEIDHPDIAGYITMESGSILFGEREGRKKKDEEEIPDLFVSNPVMDEKLERQFQKWKEKGETKKSRGSMTEILPTNGKATVKLHTSGRGDRGTQFTLGIGDQLSDIGIWNVSQTGIDQIESTITDASRQGMINSKDDMFKLSRMLQSIIEERIEDGDIK